MVAVVSLIYVHSSTSGAVGTIAALKMVKQHGLVWTGTLCYDGPSMLQLERLAGWLMEWPENFHNTMKCGDFETCVHYRSVLSWNVVSDMGTWHLAPSTNTLGSDLMGPSCTSVNLSCLRELQFQVFCLYCKLQTESVSSIRSSGHLSSGFATSCEDFTASYKFFAGWDIQAALSTASAWSTRIPFWITT